MNLAPIRRLLQMHSEPITIRRRDDTTSQQYGTDITYTELSDPRFLHIDTADETEMPTGAGEFQGQSLVGYSLSEEDIQLNDRFDYGTSVVEVTTKEGVPTESAAEITRYRFETV